MKPPRSLDNRYYVMRHGESEANVAGIILSNPVVGIRRYGLTSRGRSQAETSAQALVGEPPTVVVSSDFLRAWETAEIAARTFGVTTVDLAVELRERFFGAWDRLSSEHYQGVWDLDAVNADQTESGVESVVAVANRLSTLVNRLESEHANQRILLVAHGDPLQILQTLFEGVPATAHRRMRNLEVAEIRPLFRTISETERATG